MKKVGLMFVGQGAQYTGMGKELYDNFKSARDVMDMAGEQIKEWCFEGTKEVLKQTHVTQPTIYTVTMAAYSAFKEKLEQEGIEIDVVAMAGFSLGEYATLTVAGSISDVKTGIKIVTERGKLMHAAGRNTDGEHMGGMVATMGAREEILKCVEDCAQGEILQGVNFNSPMQTVVAGETAALERFKVLAKERRLKVVPLSVGTAFHSKMMEPATENLKKFLKEFNISKPQGKVYSNITAQDVRLQDKPMEEILAEQAKSPVYWQEIVENMVGDGVDILIEIGPGKSLCGMVKKINHDIKIAHVEDMESLENTMNLLKEIV